MGIEFRYQQIDEPPYHTPMTPLDVKEFVPEMISWCHDNLIEYWCHQQKNLSQDKRIFWFESKEDMVKFILRWE